MENLIPYYPHLVSSACYTDGNSVVHLSSESWVDIEEKDILEFRLKDLLRIYNSCKRKKIEFDVEEALKKIVWGGWNEEPYKELANRIKKNGKKATIDGIHLKMHEHYRQDLIDEMIKNGLNPLEYGDYARFIKE